MKFKKSRLVSLFNLEFNFFIVLWSNLKETLHYLSYIVTNIKKFAFGVRTVLKKLFFWVIQQTSAQNMKSKK